MLWKGFQRPKRLEFERETLTDRFGRFYAQPFERGFGTTIGNALRRVLLSSIEGAAITAVKIDGVLHEFSPIPGVVEDATDIILNLKQIPLKLHVDQTKTLTLRSTRPAKCAARDIQADGDVEILEPDAHIATVAEHGKLHMEMRMKRGRGYVSADKNFDEDLGIGIHTFISTSDIHIEHQLQTTRDDVKGQARAAVTLARSYCDDVEFSPMDATRADIEFTAEVCAIAVAEGADGGQHPRHGRLHDARGVRAVLRAALRAGSRAAGRAHLGPLPRRSGPGRRQLLRRRAGRRAAGRVRRERDRRAGRQLLARGDRDAAADPQRRARARHRPRHARAGADEPHGHPVHRLRRAAEQGGRRAATRSPTSPASIRTACSRSGRPTRSWTPRDVGLDSNSIVLGKHSGRHALRDALEQLGFKVEGNALNQAFTRFKEIADKKKQVTALDLEAIVSEEMRERAERYELAWFEVEAGSRREPQARRSRCTMPSGEEVVGEATRRRPGRRDLRRDPEPRPRPSASSAPTRSPR